MYTKSVFLFIVLALSSLTFAQQKAQTGATAVQPASTTCAFNFSSGSGHGLTTYCVTQNGNIAEFSAVGGNGLPTEFINASGAAIEGYGICDTTSKAVNYYDYASHGKTDLTEIDMRLGDLMVEAKLTETDFQLTSPRMIERYRDLEEVFEQRELKRSGDTVPCYQLVRGVLAAQLPDYALECLGCGSYCFEPAILPIMPDRVDTPILTMTSRKNAFTVLGLILIRSAISLLVRPSKSNLTVSCSRGVRLKRVQISPSFTPPFVLLSSKSTSAG
jgi:hypothetical protein